MHESNCCAVAASRPADPPLPYGPTLKLRLLMTSSLVVVVAFHISLFFAIQRFQTRRPDFAYLYQAGRAIDHQRFVGIVERFPSLKSGEYSVETSAGELPADTMHPPYEMLIYAALALFKFRIAVPVWWACNLLLLTLTAFWLWPHIPNLRDKYPYLLIVIATFFPVLVAFVQGQNSILLLALLALCYDSLARRQDLRGGFVLALGMFKFVLVLPIALWLVLEKRWKSLAGFAAGCLALFIESVWLVGIEGVEAYVHFIGGFGKAAPERAGSESLMPNLRGLVYTVGAGMTTQKFLTILTLVVSIALLIWVDSGLRRRADLTPRFSLQILLAAAISYHFFPHDAAILVLPLVLLANQSLNEASGGKFRIAVLAGCACIYLIPFFVHLELGMQTIAIAYLALLVCERIQPPDAAMKAVALR